MASASSARKRRDPEGRARPLAHLARHQPAPVGQLQGEGRAARGRAASRCARGRDRSAAAAGRPWRSAAVGAVEGEVEAELAVQRVDAPAGRSASGASASGSSAPVSSAATSRYCGVCRPRRAATVSAAGADEHRQHQQDGDVELEVEALHSWRLASPGPGPGRRRSRCRAPSGCGGASWGRPRWRRGCGETWTSTERSKASSFSPFSRSISASRDSTRPARSASASSRANW